VLSCWLYSGANSLEFIFYAERTVSDRIGRKEMYLTMTL
jgi:hypothetical protein